MVSNPESLQFDIEAGIDGDIVDGLDFTVRMMQDTTSLPEELTEEKPVIRKDTAYFIVHEVTQELITITKDSYAIQFGAFKVKSNAEGMVSKIQQLLKNKVEIVIEDGFYKVRIIDLNDRNEVDENIAILQKNGVIELWVISLKAKQSQLILTEKEDTVRMITETMIDRAAPAPGAEITVQLGAFRDKSNAMALLKTLIARYGNRVKMVFEDDFYKIRLTGSPFIKQTVLEEMNKLGPSLDKLQFKDIWVLPPVAPLEEEPVVTERPEIKVERAGRKLDIPILVKPESKLTLRTLSTIKPESQPLITISIQVAIFYRKSEALRAQRRITSKLKLKVDIVEQWDRYIVLIRGFHTREETYKYYPELAGLGYPGIYLIEEF
jgi:hypothetical protein